MEVLISLVIFVMVAVVLGAAYMNILIGYEIAERDSVTNADVVFARSLVLREPDREKVERGGQFEAADGGRIQWSAEIESTNTADLFKVTLTCEVAAATASVEPEKTVQTFLVLRPTWSTDQAERSKLHEEAKARIMEMQQKPT